MTVNHGFTVRKHAHKFILVRYVFMTKLFCVSAVPWEDVSRLRAGDCSRSVCTQVCLCSSALSELQNGGGRVSVMGGVKTIVKDATSNRKVCTHWITSSGGNPELICDFSEPLREHKRPKITGRLYAPFIQKCVGLFAVKKQKSNIFASSRTCFHSQCVDHC